MAKSEPGLGKGQCPHCKEWISSDATRCPHCQSDLSADDQKSLKGQSRAEVIGCGVLVGIALLFLGYCTLAGGVSVPEEPESDAQQKAIAFYKDVFAEARDCDAEFQRASEILQEGDLVKSYRQAQIAESACLSVSSSIEAVEVPPSVGRESYDALSEARDECSTLYLNKWSAMNTVVDILDEGESVSAVAELQGSMEQVQFRSTTCAAGLVNELIALGVDPGDIPEI